MASIRTLTSQHQIPSLPSIISTTIIVGIAIPNMLTFRNVFPYFQMSDICCFERSFGGSFVEKRSDDLLFGIGGDGGGEGHGEVRRSVRENNVYRGGPSE